MPRRTEVSPIQEGKLCAVDELGFYITSDDQLPAPPSHLADPDTERHEAFWVLATSQYVALRRVAPSPSSPTVTSGTELKTPSRNNEPAGAENDGAEGASASPCCGASRGWREGQRGSDRVAAALLHKMRKRMRLYGGLPSPRLRRLVWPFLVGLFNGRGPSGSMSTLTRSLHYNQLVHATIDSELHDVILRDLGRTFPTHCLYRDVDSVGQRTLHRVLQAYCAFDPEVGYCQGMGFIVAMLTLHMPEETAFWVFVQMMHGKHYAMRQLYLPGFPLLQQFFVIFRQLSKRLLPRLSAHFEAEGVDVSFFAAQWFMTLFSYQFPVALTCRIWDLFFSEGWKFVFKVSLALLQWDEPALLGMRMEDILLQLKTVHEGKDPQELMRRAMDVPLRERDLNAFGEE